MRHTYNYICYSLFKTVCGSVCSEFVNQELRGYSCSFCNDHYVITPAIKVVRSYFDVVICCCANALETDERGNFGTSSGINRKQTGALPSTKMNTQKKA